MRSQRERITALEQLKENSGSQYQQQTNAQYSSGVSICKSIEKFFGVFVISVIIVTYTY